jgi:hypothetical protein
MRDARKARTAALFATLLLVVWSGGTPRAFAVLAHEAMIDGAWRGHLAPLIRARFPAATTAQIDAARAHAYGGSLIQDIGYYPFGSRFFSNLLHYVRSGDFVATMVSQARTPEEYAFALGAVAHYAADNTGHPAAVNRVVAMLFPKLRTKYGDVVTYVDAPAQHVTVEFSFDVIRAAGGHYLPDAYRSFVGFEVSRPLLARAFLATYAMQMSDVMGDDDLAFGTYRYALRELYPSLTEVAWRDKHDEIVKQLPNVERANFVFTFTRKDYEAAYGTKYRKPGLFARFLGFLYRVVPKIGPLKPLSFKALTPEAQTLFDNSVAAALDRFEAALTRVRDGRLELPNTDFDTGQPARHGEYRLADDTYAEWLHELAERRFTGVPDAVRSNILSFYGSSPGPSRNNRREQKHWKRITAELSTLRTN